MPRPEILERRAAGAQEFHWIEENIPCQWACPAHTDVPAYISAISGKQFDLSYSINRHSNILPGVLGRICSRPCEERCRHGEGDLGSPVAICHLKRTAADNGREILRSSPIFRSSGKRVAIVGSGPSGLAAAHDLALLGHSVTVYEAEGVPGGMLFLGIPEFRLPRKILEEEIGYIESLGVEFVFDTKVGEDIELHSLLSHYDSTLISTGNPLANDLGIPGAEHDGVIYGLPFLEDVNLRATGRVGEKVAVIGGGFTSLDCARTARRFGGREVGLYFLSTEAYLAGTAEEIHELKFERISLNPLVKPIRIQGTGGKVSGITFIRTTPLGERQYAVTDFREIEGSEFTVEADSVIIAIGQHAAFSLIPESLGVKKDKQGIPLVRRDRFETNRRGLFLAGDCIIGQGNVIRAIAHGRHVAAWIDAHLTGGYRRRSHLITTASGETGRLREFDFIERQKMPTAGTRMRSNYHVEVEKGYPRNTALTEASRCYLCHYKFEIDVKRCIYCLACIEVAPRDCIKKVKEFELTEEGIIVGLTEAHRWDEVKAIYIHGDRCIRCGNCERVCPTRCISLTKVSLMEHFEDA